MPVRCHPENQRDARCTRLSHAPRITKSRPPRPPRSVGSAVVTACGPEIDGGQGMFKGMLISGRADSYTDRAPSGPARQRGAVSGRRWNRDRKILLMADDATTVASLDRPPTRCASIKVWPPSEIGCRPRHSSCKGPPNKALRRPAPPTIAFLNELSTLPTHGGPVDQSLSKSAMPWPLGARRPQSRA